MTAPASIVAMSTGATIDTWITADPDMSTTRIMSGKRTILGKRSMHRKRSTQRRKPAIAERHKRGATMNKETWRTLSLAAVTLRSFAIMVAFNGISQAQTELNYYFAHIASAGPWRTTFAYVNQTTLPVTCNTSFYSDTGTALPLTFNGTSMSSAADNIAAGGLARRQTDAQPSLPVVTGWAVASCNGPVKASALFRSYSGNVALAEASVTAMA